MVTHPPGRSWEWTPSVILEERFGLRRAQRGAAEQDEHQLPRADGQAAHARLRASRGARAEGEVASTGRDARGGEERGRSEWWWKLMATFARRVGSGAQEGGYHSSLSVSFSLVSAL